ncbi:hypothetical protein ASG37_13320 [Sphingomonas sp. Leaf407]|uniref:MFS transporter n=1 Tax=unclassified Sphingomonas TaxID=196159 RepID=UPI0006F5E544|nr:MULTISPECIES: MFS transporter [unclassified Sphingomonas]KQN36569.1 hypothetical protein ASE97_12575 [Sphingomonas sp. Leaf42]KQT27191.1 hypothetical protein ASG37_13320 [Sphingomonas sp. Leaf407]
MSAPDFSLLAKRRYGPLFAVQFLNAMNDNLLKFALLFLANFTLYRDQPDKAAALATIATGVFILPYFLFSGLAGQMADAWDKARLIRWVKGIEVGIMVLALVGFLLPSLPVLLVCLFGMGLHSTVFGPVKYSILPQHLRSGELMGGTGLVEAGTFVAILSGQLLGSLIAPLHAGIVATVLAIAGFVMARRIPDAPPMGTVKIDRNPLRSLWGVLKAAHGPRGIWLAITGISWFFAIGAVILSQFPPLVSGTLGATAGVVTLFLAIFSLFVAIGSLLVNRLLNGKVSARYVPAAGLALALLQIDLWWCCTHFSVVTPGAGVREFVATPDSWRLMADLAGIALFGGIFVVPLYAILQTRSPPDKRSQVIAANNIVNAVVTVVLVALVTTMLGAGMGVPASFAALGIVSLPVAVALLRLPDDGVWPFR